MKGREESPSEERYNKPFRDLRELAATQAKILCGIIGESMSFYQRTDEHR